MKRGFFKVQFSHNEHVLFLLHGNIIRLFYQSLCIRVTVYSFVQGVVKCYEKLKSMIQVSKYP
jgi:hypothetical protein